MGSIHAVVPKIVNKKIAATMAVFYEGGER
jgi:hypothetical protein